MNTYAYDKLNEMTQVSQAAGTATSSQTGANAVAAKKVDFGYDANGDLTSLARYAAPSTNPTGAATQLVANTSYGYDNAERLTSIGNTNASGAAIDNFNYAYNPLNEVTTFTSSVDGTTTYGYDPAGQLTSADYPSSGSIASEQFSYDANGNRTSVTTTPTTGSATTATSTTGADNELVTDGTYDYQYDANGNMVEQTTIATGAYTIYAYNNANEMTSAVAYSAAGAVQSTTTYQYDALGRLIAETEVDSTGAAVIDEHLVYDGSQVVMQFNGSGQLTDRYLAAVDQVLADEQYTTPTAAPTSPGNIIWPIDDAQGTDHDLIDSTGVVLDHITYGGFGNIQSQTNAAGVDYLFGYTGFLQDPATGARESEIRGYLPQDGIWNQQDPIGFGGGQTNLSEYVGNDPTNGIDPTGTIGTHNQGSFRPGPPIRHLGAEIGGEYLSRAAAGAFVLPQIVTGIDNFSGHYHDFPDDGSVENASIQARREFLVKYALSHSAKLDGQWWRLTLDSWTSTEPYSSRFNIPVDRSFSTLNNASFWLGGYNDFQGKGQYSIRITCRPGTSKGYDVSVGNLNMKWRWVDDIDAHSFVEALNNDEFKNDGWVAAGIEASIGDLIGDKLLNGDFLIHVTFSQTIKPATKYAFIFNLGGKLNVAAPTSQ